MRNVLFFLFFFQLTSLAGQQQQYSIKKYSEDSIRVNFFKLVIEGKNSEDNFIKVVFENRTGYKETAMVPKKSLEDYFHKTLKISYDSINKSLFTFLFDEKVLPLSDSTKVYEYYGITKVNKDSLIAIEKVPLDDFIKRYFYYGGKLRPEYKQSVFLLACYLYNKHIVFNSWDSGFPEINYIETDKLLGENWVKNYK